MQPEVKDKQVRWRVILSDYVLAANVTCQIGQDNLHPQLRIMSSGYVVEDGLKRSGIKSCISAVGLYNYLNISLGNALCHNFLDA